MRTNINSVLKDNQWLDASAALRRRLKTEVRDWLFAAGSLTLRLQLHCAGKGDFSVRVLKQSRKRPAADERQLLGLRDYQVALVREVQLLCADQVWVFARTVVPLRTLTGRGRRLAALGNRPLGAMLFADKSVCRRRLQVARLTAGNDIFDSAAQVLAEVPRIIWGRRSLFYYQQRPLLVSEIFLPAVISCKSGKKTLSGSARAA